jgi:hypothetical protein
MNTISEQTQTQRKLAPKGTHVARCVALVDLGTGPETWEGETKIQRKLNITWELPKQTIDLDGQPAPMRLSKKFTASIDKKATLRKFLDAWIAPTAKELAGFNPSDLLGKECLLTVGHYDKPNGETGVKPRPRYGSMTPKSQRCILTDCLIGSKSGCGNRTNIATQRVRQSHEYRNAMKGKHDSSGLDETDNAPF